jgi:SAM-dependent methyltransferase
MTDKQKKNSQKYIHTEETHDMENPSILVPIFSDMFNPKSVCDVGCGIGNFLDVFKQGGAKKVVGYDGKWADMTLVAKHLTPEEFVVIDFEVELPKPAQKFDLALCLEVGEHVSNEKSDNLVDFLTKLSDNVIFSAAIPGQGGFKHINEQWEEYWEEKFNKRGYKKYDIIRHKIFANSKIIYWYRQNIVVYSKNDLSHFPAVPLPNIITKELFTQKIKIINQLVERLKGGILMRTMRKIVKK